VFDPLNDKITGLQISAANVVVIMAPHKFLVKKGTTEIVDIELEGAARLMLTGTVMCIRLPGIALARIRF
jgi:hypothetical protein